VAAAAAVPGPVPPPEALGAAFAELQRRHPALRTVFSEPGGRWQARTLPAPAVRPRFLDPAPDGGPHRLRQMVAEAARQPLPLRDTPPVHCCVQSGPAHWAVSLGVYEPLTAAAAPRRLLDELLALLGADGLDELVGAEAPVPEPAAEPDHPRAPVPEPASGPDHLPASVPDHPPAPVSEPAAEPGHPPASVSGPASVPDHPRASVSGPASVPDHLPASVPDHPPAPVSEPAAVPDHPRAPVPEPAAVPDHLPASVVEPACGPDHPPAPIPEPAAVPDHLPAPALGPACGPDHRPACVPEHEPV
jgi:hypothetical protein